MNRQQIGTIRQGAIAAVLAATVVGVVACGGYGAASPAGPTGSSAPPGAIIIRVIGVDGAQSFSPNPASVPAGQMVAWRNVDTITHRVVLNDGELDTGNIPPGAYSAAMSLVAPGPYHCSIHPSMIGAVARGQ